MLGLDGVAGITFNDASAQGTSALSAGRVPVAKMPVGAVLQVQSSIMTTTTSYSGTTPADTGLSITITPTFATSKFFLIFNTSVGGTTAVTSVGFNFVRNGTNIGQGTAATNSGTQNFSGMCGIFNTSHNAAMCMQYLDSPATSSAITYKVQWATQNGYTFYLNRGYASFNVDANPYSSGYTTNLTVMEIAA